MLSPYPRGPSLSYCWLLCWILPLTWLGPIPLGSLESATGACSALSYTLLYPSPAFLRTIFIFLFLAHPNSSLASGATSSSSATPLQRILSSTFGPGRSLSSTFSCPRSLPVSVLSCEFFVGWLLFCSRQVARFTSAPFSDLGILWHGSLFPSLLALLTLAQENSKILVLR